MRLNCRTGQNWAKLVTCSCTVDPSCLTSSGSRIFQIVLASSCGSMRSLRRQYAATQHRLPGTVAHKLISARTIGSVTVFLLDQRPQSLRRLKLSTCQLIDLLAIIRSQELVQILVVPLGISAHMRKTLITKRTRMRQDNHDVVVQTRDALLLFILEPVEVGLVIATRRRVCRTFLPMASM